MIQTTPPKTYKIKPMSPETEQKVLKSYAESLELTERELRCPSCSFYIQTLFSDVSGHLKVKCPNCKVITTYNLSYFRRQKRCHAGRHLGSHNTIR